MSDVLEQNKEAGLDPLLLLHTQGPGEAAAQKVQLSSITKPEVKAGALYGSPPEQSVGVSSRPPFDSFLWHKAKSRSC